MDRHSDWTVAIFRVVESIGEHVEEFAVGDTVVPTFLGQCDTCPSCASEANNMCSSVPFSIGPGMRRDGTTRFRDAHGAPLHNFLAVSSFSQYTVVDVNQVVKVDPAVPPMLACLLGCGAGTGEPSLLASSPGTTKQNGPSNRSIIIRGRGCLEAGQGRTWIVRGYLRPGGGRLGGKLMQASIWI
jgi:Zn-dependent alcohol dehydrogenase